MRSCTSTLGDDVSGTYKATHHATVVEEEHPILPPGLAAKGEVELPTRQGMKRMRHPHPNSPTLRITSN